ncbi:GMC family oxidoreductase [Exilibacterium tricleocarpae]|uniref:GMC family oxidoreductase n=1 Tax=Exilibacterium tricleocarpae TaxID=2591008 RepID=A0A545T6B8_9GAMM|nr:GMC family oxidoreductase [Exilibacterium tricleocarpae]TQV72725.1 GMC family oxidoreductase [Exilibacterium tricleocarpae]
MNAKVTSREKVDLLIVGSGAAASVFAAKAAQAGKQVLMLEAGPARGLQDLVSSQLWARRLKWGGAPVEEEGNLTLGHNFNSGWGTGGSSMHHYGVWPRLHPGDFRLRTDHGKGLDWPLQYRELRPYYDRIQEEVGLSGDAAAEKWRPPGSEYPLPALPVFPQGQAIAAGFKALGKHTAPIPLAINSRPYKNRRACIYDGWCDAGCPIGALANAQALYLPQARAAGGRILHRATVTRVLANKKGNKVIGVEYRDAEDRQQVQLADVVVLAAFAVQNPRLLLASANPAHPQGLANSSGLVGRYMMTHPATSIYGLFKQETQPHLGPTGGQLISQDGYDNKAAIKNAFGSYQWLIANALKPNDLLGIVNTRPDIFGRALEAFMQRASRSIGTMVFVGEDLPLAQNRITLSQHKDQYGVPLARAVHNIQAPTAALCEHAVAEGTAVFKAAGAEQVWQGPRFGMHIMGGTVMGTSADNSVTNRYGQCHDIDNLFIAGPGLFPSSGAVNPTFTLHALGLLAVEFMLREWGSIA